MLSLLRSRLPRIALGALLLSVPAWRPPAAHGADARVFRPLTADPRESQTRWHVLHFVEDWRYGADVGDSTSRGGWRRGVEGDAWEVGAGETFRWRPLRRAFGWQGPWVRYQLGMPVGIFSYLMRGALMNNDYQFGGSLDILWAGDSDDRTGLSDFARPAVTTRLAMLHRSSHLGDQYLALGRFGRNQDGYVPATELHRDPPVKQMHLSSEVLTGTLSIEWAPPWTAARPATLRAYAGGEARLVDSRGFHLGDHVPRRMRSPAGFAGLEWRSAANAAGPRRTWTNRAIAFVTRDAALEGEWLLAVHARRARTFDFATIDDPEGRTEIWTSRLWTEGDFGRELDFHNSWHGMAGLVLRRPGGAEDRVRVGPEWVIALEWYHGYSPNGQFLDQPYRYRPRFQVAPSLTVHL